MGRVIASILTLQNNFSKTILQVNKDTRSFQNEILHAQNSVVKFKEKAVSSFTSILGKASLLAGGLGFVELGKKSVEFASDLAEIQNVIDVTFGDMNKQINGWSKNAINKYGENELQAKNFAATFGAMLKAGGVSGQELVKWSEVLSGYVGDLASFRNLKLDESFEKIRSAISGESEPMKILGYDVSETAVNAYALAHGIGTAHGKMKEATKSALDVEAAQTKYNQAVKKYGQASLEARQKAESLQKAIKGTQPKESSSNSGSNANLTQAEKLQARLGLMQQLMKDVDGDFVRTQNQFANQARIAQSQFMELGKTIGEKVLPTLTTFLISLTSGNIGHFGDSIVKVFDSIGIVINNIRPNLENLWNSLGKFAKNMGITDFFKNMFGGKNNKLINDTSYALKVVIDSIAAVINMAAAHPDATKSIFAGIIGGLVALKGAKEVIGILGTIEKVQKATKELTGLSKVGGIFKTLFGLPPQALLFIGIITLISSGAYLITKNWTPIKKFFNDLWKDVGDTFVKFKDNVIKEISDKFEDLNKTIEKHKDTIKDTARVLGVIFGPALIKTGVQATIAGGQIAGNFVVNLVKAGAAATINGIKITSEFLASLIKTGAQATISGIKITAGFVMSLIKAGAQAIITAGIITGQLIVSLASYALQGWRTVAVIAAQTLAWTVQKASILGSILVTGLLNGAQILCAGGTAILTAAQWALNAAFIASPIGWIVLGIGSLIAIGVLLYKNWDVISVKASELWVNIKAAFEPIKNLWQEAINWGADVVHSLKNGIVNTIDDAVEGAGQLADAIVKKVKDFFGIHSPSKVFMGIGNYLVQGLIKGMSLTDVGGFVKKWVGGITGDAESAVGGNVSDWISQALTITGTDSSWLTGMLKLASYESGDPGKLGTGNPNLVNNIPVGNEYATGLMQMLPSTFKEFQFSGMNDIKNPIHNIAASINYIKKRYGSVYNTPLYTSGGSFMGYATGTSFAGKGVRETSEFGAEIVFGRHYRSYQGGEKVVNATDTSKLLGGKGNINVYVIVKGNVIGNEEYADELGEVVAGKLKAIYDNM